MTYQESIIQLITEHNYREIAEVGVFRGVFAREILARCQLSRYYMIDPWIPYGGEGAGYLQGITSGSWNDICLGIYVEFLQYPECRIIRLDSIRASRLFAPQSLDLVFIDANHAYETVRQDIEAWLPIVRNGGIISGHDYGVYPGVARAVNEVFKKVQRLLGSVWYMEKNVETGLSNISP